jgi:hypothetical protein
MNQGERNRDGFYRFYRQPCSCQVTRTELEIAFPTSSCCVVA